MESVYYIYKYVVHLILSYNNTFYTIQTNRNQSLFITIYDSVMTAADTQHNATLYCACWKQ